MRSHAGKSGLGEALNAMWHRHHGGKDQPVARTAISSGNDDPLPSSADGVSCHQPDPKGLVELLENKTLLKGGTGGTLSHLTLRGRELVPAGPHTGPVPALWPLRS